MQREIYVKVVLQLLIVFLFHPLVTLQALDSFNTAVVSPVYYVMFTILTIVANMIMYKVISLSTCAYFLHGILMYNFFFVISCSLPQQVADRGLVDYQFDVIVDEKMSLMLLCCYGLLPQIDNLHLKLKLEYMKLDVCYSLLACKLYDRQLLICFKDSKSSIFCNHQTCKQSEDCTKKKRKEIPTKTIYHHALLQGSRQIIL